MLSATASQKTQDIIFHSPLHFTFYHKFTFSRTSLYKEDRSKAPLSLLTSAQTPFRPAGHVWGQWGFILHLFRGREIQEPKFYSNCPHCLFFGQYIGFSGYGLFDAQRWGFISFPFCGSLLIGTELSE